MSSNVRTFEITLGKVTNNGQVCLNPTVELAGYDDVAIQCIDETCGKYTVKVPDDDGNPCLTFIVKCEDCGDCPPEIIEVCLCDTIEDCPPCHICKDGICVKLCDLCVDGNCVNCEDNDDCPTNQLCVNGNCECPINTTLNPITGVCDECDEDTDCPLCSVCINGQCKPKECPNSVCDPETGECIECISSGDCIGVNECCFDNVCGCCEGFTLVSGVCIPEPECTIDADCPECFICVNGNCEPTVCPNGKICLGGECVDECDCLIGDCSADTDYCKESNTGLCGCVACEGSCGDGCIFPCVCDPVNNVCIDNPCEGSCSNGSGCAGGTGQNICGCIDGECTACFTLDCPSGECDKALGCECTGTTCVPSDDGCGDIACEIADDCPFGCTCFGGDCISCDNFSCLTSECANIDGCACNGTECDGEPPVDCPPTPCTTSNDCSVGCGCANGICTPTDCTDIVTMEKDDDACTLTGTLIKDNCCNCSQLTADTKGKTTAEGADSYTFDFLGELRKGAFDGISADSKPRLDEFANDDIAENEPPTSGSLALSYEITYDVYKLLPGVDMLLNTPDDIRVLQGTTTTNPVISSSSFIGGATAEVTFSGIILPKIGSETQNGDIIKVVRSTRIRFVVASPISFPNNCVYPSGTVISTYTIRANTDYTQFGGSFSNTKASTISSPSCRYPMFKWTKSDEASLNEAPFRKIYIPGDGTYVDVLTKELGLESCKYYLFEPDCTCEDPVEDWIVLCNPSNIEFELRKCNKEFILKNFVTCDVNEDITFRIQAGTIDVTFLGLNPPNDQILVSDTQITEVIYSIVCDIEGECTKTYIVPPIELEIEPETECLADDGQFKVTFPTVSSDGSCLVDYIVIGEFTLSGILSKNLPFGTYTATVFWACGCDPTVVTITQDCCQYTLPNIIRECGGVLNCTEDPNLTYSLNGAVLTDVCGYVGTLAPEQSAIITVSKGGCIDKTITVPSLPSFCCEKFNMIVNQFQDRIDVKVINFNGTLTIDVTPSIPIIDQGGGSYTLQPAVDGENYLITINDSVCGETQENWSANPCDVDVNISEIGITGDCFITATADPTSCECVSGQWNVRIDDVVDLGGSCEVFYTTSLDIFDGTVTSGSQLVNGTLVPFINGQSSIILDKTIDAPPECLNATTRIAFSYDDESPTPAGTLEIEVLNGSAHLFDDPDIVDVLVTVQGVTWSAIAMGSFFTFAVDEGSVAYLIQVIDTLGNTYSFNSTQVITDRSDVNVVTPICTDFGDVVLNSSTIEFELINIELKDGCEYDNNQIAFEISSSGIVTPFVLQNAEMNPSVNSFRKIKFAWVKDGVQVFEEFKGPPGYTSILPQSFNTLGSTYEVFALCNECFDRANIIFNDCIPLTPTPTPTPSETPPVTVTPSLSVSDPMITQQPTSTPTPSSTPGASATPTPTGTGGATPTPTASSTVTPTPTLSPTTTPTSTPPPGITQTPTPSSTPPLSATPTNTPSLSMTLTPTITATVTGTPGGTPTPTPTPTITPSVTTTTSQTPSVTTTPSFTPSISITPSFTPTITPSATPLTATGACCFGVNGPGDCSVVTEATCLGAAGTWFGAGTSCEAFGNRCCQCTQDASFRQCNTTFGVSTIFITGTSGTCDWTMTGPGGYSNTFNTFPQLLDVTVAGVYSIGLSSNPNQCISITTDPTPTVTITQFDLDVTGCS